MLSYEFGVLGAQKELDLFQLFDGAGLLKLLLHVVQQLNQVAVQHAIYHL